MSYKLKHASDDLDRGSTRVLLCSEPFLSAEQVISYYMLRWEVETFFREHKSDMSFNHFQAQAFDYRSCYTFVNLLSIAFNFLEFFRQQLLLEEENPDESPLRSARSRELKKLFFQHFQRDSFAWILQRIKTKHGRRRVQKALKSFRLPFLSFSDPL